VTPDASTAVRSAPATALPAVLEEPATGEVTLARRHAFVVVLAVVSGATDAIGFLGLGGAFTSVMTGNMVLVGLGAGRQDGTLVSHASLAIAAFVVGCVIGARVAGTAQKGDPVWPAAVTRALMVEFVVLVAFGIGWELTGGHPEAQASQLLLLALNAIALGIQSSTTQRFGVSGLSTTYLTGTLTSVVIRLTSGGALRDATGSLQILAALIIGAAAGGALALHAAPFAPLLQLLGVGAVIAGALLARRRLDGVM
jgi:uncharacterized membrane protein YoaK (UPF0700 family)